MKQDVFYPYGHKFRINDLEHMQAGTIEAFSHVCKYMTNNHPVILWGAVVDAAPTPSIDGHCNEGAIYYNGEIYYVPDHVIPMGASSLQYKIYTAVGQDTDSTPYTGYPDDPSGEVRYEDGNFYDVHQIRYMKMVADGMGSLLYSSIYTINSALGLSTINSNISSLQSGLITTNSNVLNLQNNLLKAHDSVLGPVTITSSETDIHTGFVPSATKNSTLATYLWNATLLIPTGQTLTNYVGFRLYVDGVIKKTTTQSGSSTISTPGGYYSVSLMWAGPYVKTKTVGIKGYTNLGTAQIIASDLIVEAIDATV